MEKQEEVEWRRRKRRRMIEPVLFKFLELILS